MNVQHILEIADAIERQPELYCQMDADHCIGGFCKSRTGLKSYLRAAREYLELDRRALIALTNGLPIPRGDDFDTYRAPTAAEAAATLRYLAATGIVDWLAGCRIAVQHAAAIEALKNTAAVADVGRPTVSGITEASEV